MNINKFSRQFPKYGVMTRVFTEDEIERVLFMEKLLDFDKGQVGNGSVTSHRDSNIAWMQPDENSRWFFDRIAGITATANYDLFMLDVNHVPAVQYTIYDSMMEQHYDWHIDEFNFYKNTQRKISGVMLLTGPDEYEGGELEVIWNGNPEMSEKLKPQAGEVVFFASHMPHKVHPVTSGVRKSVVFWVEGPWS